jgi:hypothetical protein
MGVGRDTVDDHVVSVPCPADAVAEVVEWVVVGTGPALVSVPEPVVVVSEPMPAASPSPSRVGWHPGKLSATTHGSQRERLYRGILIAPLHDRVQPMVP